MPEVLKEPEFIKKMRSMDPDGLVRMSSKEVSEDLATTFPETEFIGKGCECIIVGHSTDKTKVVAYSYGESRHDAFSGHKKQDKFSPSQALEIFHLQRFFSLLFPHNFPHFYASTSSKYGHETVRQKINNNINQDIKYSFKSVEQVCNELGIESLYDWLDIGDDNFITGSDGGVYYADVIKNPKILLDINEQKLENVFKKLKLSEKDKKDCLHSIRRLREIDAIKKIKAKLVKEGMLEEKKLDDLCYKVAEECGFGSSKDDENSKIRIRKFVDKIKEPNQTF
jgi:hypothetical protein